MCVRACVCVCVRVLVFVVAVAYMAQVVGVLESMSESSDENNFFSL